jgi:hypothetical protein
MAAATPPKGINVVGVDNGSHGCHCEHHGTCGHFVKAEDFLFCKWAVQKFDDAPESCVKVFKLAADGHAGCHVGYLPRCLVKSSKNNNSTKDGGKGYDGVWLKVVQNLCLSDNSAEHSRSHQNFGIAYCHLSMMNGSMERIHLRLKFKLKFQKNLLRRALSYHLLQKGKMNMIPMRNKK